MQTDGAIAFLDKFNRGEILAALQAILPYPNSAYDDVPTQNVHLLKALVVYVDATVYNTQYYITEQAIIHLKRTVQSQPNIANHFPFFPHILEFELHLLHLIQNTNEQTNITDEQIPPPLKLYFESRIKDLLLTKQDIDNIIALVPDVYQTTLSNKINLSQSWIIFKKNRPELSKLINTNLPWHSFHFSLSVSPIITVQGETPLIFMELCQMDFTILQKEMGEAPSIFVFETKATFLQSFQFPILEKLLRDPKHLIYILELYPNEQLLIQNCRKISSSSFKMISFFPKSPILEGLSAFSEALQKCLQQTDSQMQGDTENGNWLYTVSKRILFKMREKSLGISRAAALLSFTNLQNWFDPHKGLPPSNVPLGPDPLDYFGQRLQQLSVLRKPRPPKRDQPKIKLAHVVSQIVEGGHAPTRLLKTLLNNYDREKYEIILISTEILQNHPFEYPYRLNFSTSSKERAPNLLQNFQSSGISIYIADGTKTYEETALITASILKRHEIDIAVFHVPQEIHLFCAQITDVPVRVVFEHGTHPAYPGFDIEIVSTVESLDLQKELFKKLHIEAYALPFAVDVKKNWDVLPPSRKSFGLPENGFLMTTISNHLDSRIGSEMCLAIAEILQQCPNAYYTPIGPTKKNEYFHQFFKEHGVAERVIFLGEQENPSNIARMMNLYLNEFPVGSGLGILDAMASGCPIVTQYDVLGPPQAQYGGIYFGIDRAITSGKREEYVKLACKLVNNKEFYEEWSEHAIAQYEKRANVRQYVTNFEKIIEQVYKRYNGI